MTPDFLGLGIPRPSSSWLALAFLAAVGVLAAIGLWLVVAG